MQPSTVSEPCSRNATCLASNTHSMNPLKLKAMAPKKHNILLLEHGQKQRLVQD